MSNAYGLAVLRRVLAALDDSDYAEGITDLYERVMLGCRNDVGGYHADQLRADLSLFSARLARHEFTVQQGKEVAVAAGEWGIRHGSFTADQMIEYVESVRRVLDGYASGPAHMIALEKQWLCYTVAQALAPSWQPGDYKAMQPSTWRALRVADTYCWSPDTVGAVAAAAQSLPGASAPSVQALGDMAPIGKSGWWWFQEPLPVRTTNEHEPVAALLWARQQGANGRPMTFMQVMVMARVRLRGRDQLAPVPSVAWLWPDGLALDDLPDNLRSNYEETFNGLAPKDATLPGVEPTVEATMWFSRFLLSAAAWLRQRIAVPQAATGMRQVARALQREHKLPSTPRVQVVELRRRAASPAAQPQDQVDDGARRRLSCRFVVRGFWRNQWYPSSGTHAPKYIESYLKGPGDAPLRESPRVYMVRR